MMHTNRRVPESLIRQWQLPGASLLYWASDDEECKILTSAKTIIGRSPPTDGPSILVDDSTVSRRHCRLRDLGNGRYEVEDLDSTGGTWVLGSGGWTAIQRGEVGARDEIRLGDFVAVVSDLVARTHRPQKPNVPPQAGRIIVQRDPETGEIVRRSR